ncbi:MAG TPA: glycerol kinase GlpK [Rhodanobacteraceae bacterium]|nr:glycerol kinase GlpK [Rhodanobacteraceae bacterium]
MTHFLVLDQGTSSSRAMLFDRRGRILATARRELAVACPHPGWVEQDALDIWISQREAAGEALAQAGIDARDVAALGIANQRETTIVWDRADGRPIAPAIVWQDRRTAALCRRLHERGADKRVRAKTGLRLDPYFSATKIAWVLEHVEGARERARRGDLAFGTVDSWLVWNLTEGRVHATDVTNASRTLLFDIDTLDWDDELLELFDIPRALLPEVRPSAGRFGSTRLCGGSIELIGVAGDQPAALLGQQCRKAGQVKNTYGTGAFVLMQAGSRRLDAEGLIASPVCSLPGEPAAYGLEGSIFVAGAWVQWLRDGLGLIEHAADIEALAREAPDSGGVTIVPALTGLGAPIWDPVARGTILGLTRGTNAAQLARASLEAIAFRTRDVVEAMRAALAAPVETLRVDGGAAGNDLLLQIQADVLGVPILRPEATETTALGAAMLAAAGSSSIDADGFGDWWQVDRRFDPAWSKDARDRRYAQWQRALERARDWARDTET